MVIHELLIDSRISIGITIDGVKMVGFISHAESVSTHG